MGAPVTAGHCPSCGHPAGGPGLVHVRHDNGGGHNEPCPLTPPTPEHQPESAEVTRDADISEDGLYRYHLYRCWDPSVHGLAFVMLNPSTADGTTDDPTIRRCMRFARDLGFGGMYVVNLYAFRATKPADLWKAADPVGPRNDAYLKRAFVAAGAAGKPVIAAWGANARPDRVAQVLDLPLARESLHALGLTKDGAPRHPLYLRADSRPMPFRPAKPCGCAGPCNCDLFEQSTRPAVDGADGG